jgi:hypothetical protein
LLHYEWEEGWEERNREAETAQWAEERRLEGTGKTLAQVMALVSAARPGSVSWKQADGFAGAVCQRRL